MTQSNEDRQYALARPGMEHTVSGFVSGINDEGMGTVYYSSLENARLFTPKEFAELLCNRTAYSTSTGINAADLYPVRVTEETRSISARTAHTAKGEVKSNGDNRSVVGMMTESGSIVSRGDQLWRHIESEGFDPEGASVWDDCYSNSAPHKVVYTR